MKYDFLIKLIDNLTMYIHTFFFSFQEPLPGPPTLKQRNKELEIIFQETKEMQGQLFVYLATVLLHFSSILLPSSLGII